MGTNLSHLTLGLTFCLASCTQQHAAAPGSSPVATLEAITLCPAIELRAIEVEVVDSITDQPVADSARGKAVDGTFQAVLGPVRYKEGRAVAIGGADERPGTYDITVERPGYLPWRVSHVVVRDGRCNVITVQLTARLSPVISNVNH